ncbi:protein of unknown function DUF317 [Actinobacteria bacterium OK074]|nr:protein of unknown function DUF317 [Actinobacteria bacterium OK074]
MSPTPLGCSPEPSPSEDSKTRPTSPPARYRVSPRYLAGDDDALTEQVCDTLLAHRWTLWTTRHQELHLFDPEQLRIAEYLPLTPQLLLDHDPVVWQFCVRPHREALPLWNAYVTANTPHEVVTAFVDALATEKDVVTPASHQEARSALAPLARAGWAPDPTDPTCTYYAPRLQACATLCLLPPEVEDSNSRPSARGWLAWAESENDGVRQWAAAFSPSTPAALVTRFCTALANPTPVGRHQLPPGTGKYLTVSL